MLIIVFPPYYGCTLTGVYGESNLNCLLTQRCSTVYKRMFDSAECQVLSKYWWLNRINGKIEWVGRANFLNNIF